MPTSSLSIRTSVQWLPVCPSPHNWKWGDPVTRKPSTSSCPGSGDTRAKDRAAKGSQAHHTEMDQESEGSAEEDEGTLKDDDKAESESLVLV